MDNWFKLQIVLIILSWSYPPAAFILLPLGLAMSVFVFFKTF